MLLAGVCLLIASCTPPPAKTDPPAKPSQIKVDVRPGGPVILTTSSAEFQILPSGYIQASLLKGDQKLTLDEPGAGSDFLVQDGKEVGRIGVYAPDIVIKGNMIDSITGFGYLYPKAK